MNININAVVSKEDDIYLIEAFEVPVDTFGETLEEAMADFNEAIELYFETAVELNVLDKVLKKIRKEQKRLRLEKVMKPGYYFTMIPCVVPAYT